jgi:hypothetical protein
LFEYRNEKFETMWKHYRQQPFWASWSLVELSFRIKFSLSRKLSGYELPAISNRQNVAQCMLYIEHSPLNL